MNFAGQGIKGHSMGVKFHRDWIRNKTRELDQFIGFTKNPRKLVYSIKFVKGSNDISEESICKLSFFRATSKMEG